MDNQLTDKEIADKQQGCPEAVIEEGSVYEDMVKHKGWGFILAEHKINIARFINGLLLTDKPITEFDNERNELKAVAKLIKRIDNSIQVAIDERQKSEKSK